MKLRINIEMTANAGPVSRRTPFGHWEPARYRVSWSATERWDPARPATDYQYRLAYKRGEAGSEHVYGERGLMRALLNASRSIVGVLHGRRVVRHQGKSRLEGEDVI